MVSIKELRKICQRPEDSHNPDVLLETKLPRIISIYITRILIYTPLKPDHVTMLMIAWGFLVGFLLSFGTYWHMLAGTIIAEFILVLDCIDGELARYKKISSLRGVFLDLTAHLIHIALPFIGLTIGLYRQNPSIYIVIAGLSASVFSVLASSIQSIKHHIIFKEIVEYSKKLAQKKSKKVSEKVIKQSVKYDILKPMGRRINYLYNGIYIMQIFLLAAIFNKLQWVLFFYGLTFPIWWLVKLAYEYKIGYKPYEHLLEPYKK